MYPLYPSCQPACGPETAVDGGRETCTRSEAIGQRTESKKTWWKVDLGGNRSIYNIDILFKEYSKTSEMRQRGRFAGFSLYLSTTPNKEDGHLCYRNTFPLPSLEFKTTCIGYGRYVIYYNERLDGVTYPSEYQNVIFTELCEVKVQGCASEGFYGRHCNLHCPENCYKNRCNIISGTCIDCIPGWTGDMCTKKCSWGWHGVSCKIKCVGHCIRNQTCNHVTGQCDVGCAEGWMGKLCDEQCKAGFYGPGCIQNCSGNCLNDTYCNRETGHCDTRCNPGYLGEFCNKRCPPSLFGNNCREQCSTSCRNKKCHHASGACMDGCLDGFLGIQCYNSCKEGYFGTNCINRCPSNCNNTCHHIDGSCSQGAVEDNASTEPLAVEVPLSIVVTIIAVLVSAVFIGFIRKKNPNLFKRKINQQLPLNCKSACIGHDVARSNANKTFYEELGDLGYKTQYQDLHLKPQMKYENLLLKTV